MEIMVPTYLNELLQILVPALIGALSGYLINQLPQMRIFRGSKFLLIALVVELAMLGGIWAWLSGEASITSNARDLLKNIGLALLGAFLMNLVQVIIGSLRGGQSPLATSLQPGTNPKTVVKRTRMKGKRNKTNITQKDLWVEDTNIDGEDQEFNVREDSNPPSSPQPLGKLNP